ncbi:MAG TPA: serine/threonine-protein kinase [Polyangiaceae bacterium]|nr:serine/threonine-protein kinase [Polyangiaceae bacterium]
MNERDESPSGQISIEELPNHTETRLKSTGGAPAPEPRPASPQALEPAPAEAAPAEPAPISNPKNRVTLSEIEPAAEPPTSRRLVLIPDNDDGSTPLPIDHELPAPSIAEADELVGQLVDARYRIESVLGIGSMGIVYVARHLAVGKRVALKVLRQQFVQDAEVTQRFAAEATAATAIGNAHIVDTLDFGKLQNGSAYQVMEFLEGQMLSEALSHERRMPLERILNIARQVAVALGAAHEAGIVHRDLKPDNVFLVQRGQSRDFVKILDFGIAKFGVGQNDLTHAGAVFGTPNYMAPEQALGKETSPATDVYALGVILYEMASGAVPFQGESPIAVLTRHATESPEPLAKRVKGLPVRFQKLVQRCLEKEPAERFASMLALIAELDAVCAGIELPPAVRAPSASSSEQEDRAEYAAMHEPSSHSGRTAVLVLVALLGAAYGGFKLHEAGLAPAASGSALPAPAPPALSADDAKVAESTEKTRDVALVLFPLDAHVVVGDHDLGAMPVTVKVPEGHAVSAEVRRDGYWTRKLRLDGTKTRIVVGLVKREGNALPAASSGPAAPADDGH